MIVRWVALAALVFSSSAALAQEAAKQPSVLTPSAQTAPDSDWTCSDLGALPTDRRVICADVAAFDNVLVYNRFGSYNPFGMIFALRRDLIDIATPPSRRDAAECAADAGVEKAIGPFSAGAVRLRDCKRPRPLVLRANVGDLLAVRVTNLLRDAAPDHSRDFCNGSTDHQAFSAEVRDALDIDRRCSSETGEAEGPEWPSTRGLNFAVQGLVAIPDPRDPASAQARADLQVCRGLTAIAPDRAVTCFYEVDRAAPYFLSSNAAPAGGEGDGGSITHGLFGAVLVQDEGSEWYRSQVSQSAMDFAWPPVVPDLATRLQTGDHRRSATLNYEAAVDGIPILNLLTAGDAETPRELVHSDLNAIIRHADDQDNFREFSVFFHDELKSFYTKNFEELARYGQLAGVRDGFAINYGASGMGTLLLANRKRIGPAADCIECLYEEFFLTSWANGDPALLERYADDPSNVHHSYLNDEIRFRNFHAGPKETHVFHLHAHQWFAGNDPNRGAYLDSQTVAPQQSFSYRIYGGGLDDYDGTPSDPWMTRVGSGNRNRSIGDSIFHCHLYPHFAQGMWELWRVHDVLEDGTRLLPDGQAAPGLSVDLPEGEEPVHRRPGSVDPDSGRWLARGIDQIEADADAAGGTAAGIGTPVPAIVPIPGRALPVLPTYAEPTNTADNAAMAKATDDAADQSQTAAAAAAATAESAEPAAPPATDTDTPQPFLTADGKAAMPGYPFYIAGRPGHRPPQAPMDIARAVRDEAGAESNPSIAVNEYLDAGLPRHVVASGERTLGIGEVPAGTPAPQVVAKMLALGDMTAHMETAELYLLPYEGTPLERAAMGFHGDGNLWPDPEAPAGPAVPVAALTPGGLPAPHDSAGGYRTGTLAADGTMQADGLFTVNGSLPKPGAPFADPCGAPARGTGLILDPLTPWIGSASYRVDPAVKGFRRYEASAVQLDLITNRAGWHDPQARINVLTRGSDTYKENNSGLPEPISPFVSAREQPFFFRAFSTECIEFRHTNELPKELALDDFQVKTPTDTIGQHIHLVKFDVTASDGSGNGFNYEDGTLASDEIAARICAAKTGGQPTTANRPAGALELREAADLCEPVTVDGQTIWQPRNKRIWALKRSENPALFQTTTQRWFADPLLSASGDETGEKADRTLRTVFSHDHFGPSSIQQHGFYTALIVEPDDNAICPPEIGRAPGSNRCRRIAGLDIVSDGDEVTVGSHRTLLNTGSAPAPGSGIEPLHPDTREYALAVADFALLYDPRDRPASGAAAAEAAIENADAKGMAKLACEARHRGNPAALEESCGSPLDRDGTGLIDAAEAIPAWNAAGRPGSASAGADLLAAEASGLASMMADYRRRASLSDDGRMAHPVAAPERPEAISVDHHDPYLVNYRGEPMPLRLASKQRSGSPDCRLTPLPIQGTSASGQDDAALVRDTGPCSYAFQRSGEVGDPSNVFLSSLHGDPATPLIETYAGERTLIRLIQGAQEVQHALGIEGFVFRRNFDQVFPRGDSAPPGTPATAKQVCDRLAAVAGGYPAFERAYMKGKLDESSAPQAVKDHFGDYERAARHCLNIDGYAAAQEIGISEHFEIAGAFQQTFGNAVLSARRSDDASADPRDRRRFSTDYLYDFNTHDSLWNGAWGLFRVYRDAEARDLTRCEIDEPGSNPAACSPLIGARLPTIKPPEQEFLFASGTPALPEQIMALGCDPDAPKARAAVAAIEARRVFGADGLRYGPATRDADGLVLLPLDPEALDAVLTRPDARGVLEQQLRDDYADDPVEPYVLPVKAGECVELTTVNLLTERLPDNFGDARMPPITPFNTTVADEPVETTPEGSLTRAVAIERGSPWRNGMQPSSRLALRFPLPTLNQNQSTTLPFGFNATTALMPSGPTLTLADTPADAGPGGYLRRDASVERVTFYAGRMSVQPGNLSELLAEVHKIAVRELPGGTAYFDALKQSGTTLEPLARADYVPLAPELIGDQYRPIDEFGNAILTTDEGAMRLYAEAFARAGQTALAERAHWMPYAFGALPIKSFGDAIGHGSHGLIGAILVLPENAILENGDDDSEHETGSDGDDSDGDDDMRIIRPRPTPAGQAIAVVQPPIEEPGADCASYPDACITRRNFVLFYQDGLNLWDDGSRIRWTYKDGTQPLSSAIQMQMQPDCAICDDSYDLGDRGVSYHAAPLHARLREPGGRRESDGDLNAATFPSGFWMLRPDEDPMGSDGAGPAKARTSMPVLRAEAGEEIVISVLEPSGRARQRAFVTIAQDYDDLFPGFGFPHSALITPGKAVNAALSDTAAPGCYLWHDGPTHLRAGGTWGLLDVVAEGEYDDARKTSCRAP